MKMKRKLALGLTGIIFVVFLFCGYAFLKKGMNHWFSAYIGWGWEELLTPSEHIGPKHIIFLMVDHYEPTKEQNVQPWMSEYPIMASKYVDSDGIHPRYTWFFPIEQFDRNEPFVRDISLLCGRGFGEIELHLHHGGDNEASLRSKLKRGIDDLQKYGALKTIDGQTAFAFIHGSWALDNSVEVNGKDGCGVNNELIVLKEEGCYADFTFPASGTMAQPNKVNSLYYAVDDPNKPKSYDSGIDAKVGDNSIGDLLIFQGPHLINWGDWRHILYPSIEDGQLQASNPPMPFRIDQWIKANIHVKGKPDWIFVKVFTHGASPKNWSMLFSNGFDDMFDYLVDSYNDGTNYALHFVTAREAYNIVKAAEDGMDGNPNQYRNYMIQPYLNSQTQVLETKTSDTGDGERLPTSVGGQETVQR